MSSSRWDRPPPPHDWRWVVGTLGKVLIAIGLLMFGFVAYQLWGTGLEYAQAQDRLDDEFAQLLAGAPAAVTTTTAATAATATTTTTTMLATSPPATDGPAGSATPTTPVTEPVPTTAVTPAAPAPVVAEGDVLARIEVASIGLDAKVVSGVQPSDLKNGPGHYPETPVPGQLGNSAIAGHRTTYGQPFFRLDELVAGDEIVLTTVQGRFVYRMTSSEVVGPGQSDVVATTDPAVARLTLTTCHPKYTAAKRLIVFADLDAEASAPPQEPVVMAEPVPDATLPGGPAVPTPASPPTTATSDTATATATSPTLAAVEPVLDDDDAEDAIIEVGEASADAFAHGWFSDDGAFAQVALWGLVLAAIGIGAYLLSRRLRRNWVGALVAVVPFVLVLYFFFQNVNRLLPAAL